MDFNLKQWRKQEQHESDEQEHSASKLQRLLFDPYQHSNTTHQPSSALPLFVSDDEPPTTTTKLSHLSADSTVTATKFPKMGSYFSLSQWQELELQALIFRHMLAGAPVPPELLHLVKKSLPNTPYYPLQHYPHYYPYQSALLQSGYWGRGALDPEPGRCRRTDGKKWRCSREVMAGHKYCERHMHRGRNRSRKPVEIPTPSTLLPPGGGAASGHGGGSGVVKTNNPILSQPLTAMPGGDNHFGLSRNPSMDLLHFHQRSQTVSEEAESGGHRTLRHFFDDWPRSLQGADNAGTNGSATATNLSISTPGNPSSDFSLKLSTGSNGEERIPRDENFEGERRHIGWVNAWGTNQLVAPPMGGPLAEALRSSTSNSSPTSVLHRMPPGSNSETSYVST